MLTRNTTRVIDQNPAMVYPEPCKQLTKKAAGISGWEYPLLTFYPGFDCGFKEACHHPKGRSLGFESKWNPGLGPVD